MSKIKALLGLNFKSNRDKIFYLVLTALLIALYIVIDKTLTMVVNPVLKTVSLNFIPVVVAAIMLGPVASAAVFGLGDMLGSILFPVGAPIILLWLTSATMGFVYGAVLYCPYVNKGIYGFSLNKKAKINVLLNIIITVVLTLVGLLFNKLIISTVFNTLILASIYGGDNIWGYFLVKAPLRLSKSVVDIVLQTVAIPLIIPVVKKIGQIKR